jgi:hypothetical protein
MSYKYFYLLILFGVSLLSVLFLVSFYFQLKFTGRKDEKTTLPLSVLFISLALFSWIVVVFSKFFDQNAFSLLTIVNDRLFSTLSNLFFVLSVNFMPSFRDWISRKYKISAEQWMIGALIIFTVVLITLSLADKMNDSLPVIAQNLVIIFDSVISISAILLVGLAFFLSFRLQPKMKFINAHVNLVFGGLCLTQILLPISKIYPATLLPYYPYFLALFLVFLCGFFQLLYLFYPLQIAMQHYNERSTLPTKLAVTDEGTIKKIELIGLDALPDTNSYHITIKGLLDNGKLFEEQIEVSKLIQPALYWFLFGFCKNMHVLLHHPDMAVIKFRIADLWNKNAKFKVNQDVLFFNHNSCFEFNCKTIELSENAIKSLKSKAVFRNLVLKHFICFIPEDIIKAKSLINRKNFETYTSSHFDNFYKTLLL